MLSVFLFCKYQSAQRQNSTYYNFYSSQLQVKKPGTKENRKIKMILEEKKEI